MLPLAKLERAGLSRGVRPGQPGRYARIILRQGHRRVAVTASVSTHQAGDADAFLSSALLWFAGASDRSNGPYLERLVLVVQGELLRAVLARLPFLRQAIREAICVWKIDASWSELEAERVPERNELWRKRLPRFPPHYAQATSQSAKEIIALAPEAIDSVHSKKGETLRYFGLPFARVRQLLGRERIWFGLDYPTRKLLENKTLSEWSSLLEELREHRKADADRRHALYRNASEAWLEALLRRDISKLDPGMVVAPIYAQFRTAMGGRSGVRPIDLLALRQDGRLVVIELKAFEDREHVFQGVGYWQRVEAHRRRGHLASANLFDSRTINDEPPLVYLVAPTLRVHPAFQKLASFVARDIEIYRFDISEDWRSGVRVMRRLRVN
jgi:hypothetical protein